MQRIIWWVRRDLRLTDNATLHHALNDGASVIPVFILDPRLLDSDKLAPARRQFLFDALRDLDARLRKQDGRLILRRGRPANELPRLVRETHADAVYFHRDYTPFARTRDEQVTRALNDLGVRVETFGDVYLSEPEQVLKDDGTPYTVFTRFRIRFEERVGLPARFAKRKNLNTPSEIASLDLPTLEINWTFASGGETEAQKLARTFFRRANGVAQYGDTRNDLGADATSHLSPHLHFGTVSARELVRAARDRQTSADAQTAKHIKTWIDEIVWREFFAHVLYHFPHAARQAFRADYKNLAWENDAEKFAAWCTGRTGFPVVDAGMRQLNATGWMHNRARMIVASFLTKDLLIDWRWGEKYFLQKLIDGDVASNNGGWQWSASTGTDAQPFFRIFNPVLQGKRFDPNGDYVRRWVPELAHVATRDIHAPWESPQTIADYPAPIVEHAIACARALALFRR